MKATQPAVEATYAGTLLVRNPEGRIVSWNAERKRLYGTLGTMRLPNGMPVEIPALPIAGFATRTVGEGGELEYFAFPEPPRAEDAAEDQPSSDGLTWRQQPAQF
jgi:hypothetical protein